MTQNIINRHRLIQRKINIFQTVIPLVIIAMMIIGCGQQQNSENKALSVPTTIENTDKTISVTEPTKQLPKMVDLGADKCVPCKAMAPILVELGEEYKGKVEVEFIDVWKDPAPGKEAGIRMIPTQIFYDSTGTERFRHEGFYSKDNILSKWKELGFELGSKE